MKVRTTPGAWLYPRLAHSIPRVGRSSHSKRHSGVFPAFLGMASVFVLALLLGCNDYNPYLGATPTVSSSITSISPSGATAPVSQDLLLTVNGAGFVAGSSVTWNSSGSASIYLRSNFISGSEMQADISTSLLTPGIFFVGVIAPGPTSGNNAGNNISNFVPFCVYPTSGCPSAVSGADSAALPSAKLSLARLSALIQTGPRYQTVVADSADGSAESGSGIAKIFLRDTCLGAAADCAPQIFPVSVGWNGADPNGSSTAPSVSADGRFVVFASEANNLVKDDTNAWSDIFLRDTCIGSVSTCVPATILLSLGPDGAAANSPSSSPAISPDGRFVAFNSSATNLVPQLANSLPASATPPLFLRDTCLGAASGCVPNTSLVIPAAPAGQK